MERRDSQTNLIIVPFKERANFNSELELSFAKAEPSVAVDLRASIFPTWRRWKMFALFGCRLHMFARSGWVGGWQHSAQ